MIGIWRGVVVLGAEPNGIGCYLQEGTRIIVKDPQLVPTAELRKPFLDVWRKCPGSSNIPTWCQTWSGLWNKLRENWARFCSVLPSEDLSWNSVTAASSAEHTGHPIVIPELGFIWPPNFLPTLSVSTSSALYPGAPETKPKYVLDQITAQIRQFPHSLITAPMPNFIVSLKVQQHYRSKTEILHYQL